MRPELDALVTATLEGDDPSLWVLKHLLDYCVDLEAQSPKRWAGQRTERSWPDPGSANTMPELMYFLPTPAEFEEVKRRFRLSLTQDGRLNVAVMRALYRAADHSVLFPLVDVLQGYDGDPSRYDEVAAAMNILPFATADAPDAGSARARRALEHVRDIGADIVSQGYSLRYWANNALVEFGDDEGDSQMDEEHPLPEGLVELKAVSEAVLSELFAARTADVVVAVDKLDEQCASHLHGWSALGEGGGTMGIPFVAVSGTLAETNEDFNPFTALRSGMWVSLLEPASLPRLFEDIAAARWQRPDLVQVLVKDDEPYFVLYMLRDGQLRRCGPGPSGEVVPLP